MAPWLDGRASLCLLALFVSLHSVACFFFHEPSAVTLQSEGQMNGSDFGFSMGYWNENIIVGAPSSNFFGEVYSCPVSSSKIDNCTNVDLHASSSDYTLDLNPNQKFYLGATIAVTDKYFFTCAPLVTKTIKRKPSKRGRISNVTYTDAFGSCFVYNGTPNIAKGPDDRFAKASEKLAKLSRIEGGTGWGTLADKKNGFIITAKTSVTTDINYYYYQPSESQLKTMPISLYDTNKNVKTQIDSKLNVGYGLAAGKFFSRTTVYAVSMQTNKMTGEIIFLQPWQEDMESNTKTLKLVLNRNRIPYTITDQSVNAMFGYTLAATDLNLDGLSELLIGAPAQTDESDELEYGALHIYLGGDINSEKRNRMRCIFGNKERSRFGTAVAANDVDGDNIPEIFVGAPYEDDGVVYILSGNEVRETLLTLTSANQISLANLHYTQRIQRAGMNRLGFSLLVVPDVNGNECDELAIGAPGTATVLLLKCPQTVHVTLKSQVAAPPVLKVEDMTATVTVCIYINFSSTSANIFGHILVTNTMDTSVAIISEPSYKVNLSERKEENCKNITIVFGGKETATYRLYTHLRLTDNEKILQSEDFNPSWAVFSSYSELEKTLKLVRRCNESDCNPHLTMEIKWTGSANETVPYKIGSTQTETLYIEVTNTGYEAYDACVRVSVKGARVLSGIPKEGEFECGLPSTFKRNTKEKCELQLSMNKLSNKDVSLRITAKLRNNCKRDNFTTELLNSPYSFDEEMSLIALVGFNNNLNVTDEQILDENKSFEYYHEYWIINNSSITWRDVHANVTLEKRKVIKSVIATDNCVVIEEEKQFLIDCDVTILPNTTEKIIISVELLKNEVDTKMKAGQSMNETSQMKLYLEPTDTVLEETIVTVISMKKDLSFGNKKELIILVAVILAILVLILIGYILYKNGFFKRTQKKKLDVLRDSVRRRSIRLASERKNSQKPSTADNDHCDIEVVDDCAFEEAPATTNDDVVLVESEVQIHNEPQNSKQPDK